MDLDIVNKISGACHCKFQKIEMINDDMIITLDDDELIDIVFLKTISEIEEENKDTKVSIKFKKNIIVVVEQ